MTREQISSYIVENQALVYNIASKYSTYIDIEDLVQAGNIGFVKAAENFDESYGVPLGIYARKYIKGEILKYLRETKPIKVTKEIVAFKSTIDKAKIYLLQKLMREPTTFELALFLETTEEKINEVESAMAYVDSLDRAIVNDDKDLLLMDVVTRETLYNNEDMIMLKEEIKKLTEEERRLIGYRYYIGLTQQETAQELGINQVQVSRVENKILTRIRCNFSQKQ